MNDLVSVLALPAAWSRDEPARILDTFLDALLRMVDLAFVYGRTRDFESVAPIEILRISPASGLEHRRQEIHKLIGARLGEGLEAWPPHLRQHLRDEEFSIVPLPLGLQGEIGIIFGGSMRPDFPRQTEHLVLNVAANQAATGLQQARLLKEQKLLVSRLDERVAQRTAGLAAANRELKREIAERKRAEDELKSSEARHRLVIETASDAIISIDERDVILLANPATKSIFGYDPAELVGQPLTVLMPEPLKKFHETGYRRYLETGERHLDWQGTEVTALRANGEVFPVEVSFGEMRSNGRRIFTGFIRDITEKKRADEARRTTEQSLRLVVDGIAGLVAIMTAKGEVEVVNRQALDYFGKTIDQLNSSSIADAVHPEDLADVVSAWQNSVNSGSVYDVDQRLRRVDGEYRWFHARALPLHDPEGRILRWYVLLTDIHDRKQAEKALLASEQALASIINTIPTTAWSTRPDGYCDFLNQRWLDYAGMSAEEARGWGWRAAIHPDDVNALEKYWQSCLASGTPFDTEARIRRFNGSYRWFLFRANPLRDESGKIVKWYGTTIDIDDRKRAEEQLRRSEAFLVEGQRLSRTGSFSWSTALDGITCSDELYRILDFEPGTPVTFDRIGTRVHPEDLPLLQEMVRQARSGTSDFEYDLRLVMPDSPVKHLRLMAHRVRAENRNLEYIGAIQDVTQRRRSEEALAKARSELAHMTRVTSLGALTASVAHEINQPLSGISTNAITCLRMLNGDPPNLEGARETARRALRDVDRTSAVIARLRALFSKTGGTLESVDLNEAAREVVALSLSDLQRNRVNLQQELADDLPSVRGDRVQLQQVILNLLRNGSDSMNGIEDRSRTLLIRTERDEDDHVRLSVRDAGIGFDPDQADKIFEAFYTTKEEGMGIGLSVSRSIIESHYGRLWAVRNDGPGSTFAFSIPCHGAPEVDAD